MAGIGLELKKIYSDKNISNIIAGTAYSSMVTIGPTLLIVAILLLMYLVLGLNNIGLGDRELLTSTILYIFIFGGILVSPFNAVFSRYIADKIYQKEPEDILPSYYTGIALVSSIGSLMSVPIIYRLLVFGGVEVAYVCAAYVFWMSINIVSFSSIYLHATKDYKAIFGFYFVGMSIAFLIAYVLQKFFFVGIIMSLIYGLAVGFFIVAFLEMAQVKRWFKSTGQNHSECLRYLWRFKALFIANGFYTVGLYAHNFVFWTTDGSVVVAETFVSHMAYDMATCLAVFSNISMTVMFTVFAETEFHDDYQQYMQAVIGGTYRLIEKNKNIMFRTLEQQLLKLVAIQSLITAVIFLLAITFLPGLYFGELILTIYPALCLGYFILFVMYSMIIYLYYFNDQKGCVILSTLFMVGVFIGTWFTKELAVEYYGLGFVFGAFLGFSFGYFRLRGMEGRIDEHIFCDKMTVKNYKYKKRSAVIYKNK